MLLVIARATDEEDLVRDPAMMPWPLTRGELEAMAGNQLTVRSVEKFFDGVRAEIAVEELARQRDERQRA